MARYEKVVKKLWGWEYWIVNNDLYCGKLLLLKEGFQSSLHYHKEKDETFHLLSGEILLEVNGEVKALKSPSTVRLTPGTRHRFRSLVPKSLIVEVSTKHQDLDVVRLENSSKCNVPTALNSLPGGQSTSPDATD